MAQNGQAAATMYITKWPRSGAGGVITPAGNPPNWAHEIKPHYNKLKIPGLSHQVKQYSHTDNLVPAPIVLEWFGDTDEERNQIEEQRATLESWLVSEGTAGLREAQPPRVMVFWPPNISLLCEIHGYKWEAKEMWLDGKWLHAVTTLTVEEARDERLYPAIIRTSGLNRAV